MSARDMLAPEFREVFNAAVYRPDEGWHLPPWELLGEASRMQDGWLAVADRALGRERELLDALNDMLAGWHYIRRHYGDLPGVGWDRCDTAATAAITRATGVAPPELVR